MKTKDIKTLFYKKNKLIVPFESDAIKFDTAIRALPEQGEFLTLKTEEKFFRKFVMPGMAAFFGAKSVIWDRLKGTIGPPPAMTVEKVSRDALAEWLRHVLEDICDPQRQRWLLPSGDAVYVRALLILAETVFPAEVAVPTYPVPEPPTKIEDENAKRQLAGLGITTANYYALQSQLSRLQSEAMNKIYKRDATIPPQEE